MSQHEIIRHNGEAEELKAPEWDDAGWQSGHLTTTQLPRFTALELSADPDSREFAENMRNLILGSSEETLIDS